MAHEALERKDSAADMVGAERSDELADAWETATEALQEIADQLENLESDL